MDIEKQNFISVDGKSARNSYGEFFTIGNTVIHQDKSVGRAVIQSFTSDTAKNEVRVDTDKGYAYIDFISQT